LFFSVLHLDYVSETWRWDLWKSDGTTAGTALIKEIPELEFIELLDNIQEDGIASSPVTFGVGLDGVAYFAADDGDAGGKELWKSNGTAEGTMVVKDIYTGIASSSPEKFTSTDTNVFFTADDGVNGRGLWRTDGSKSGTEMIMGEQDSEAHYRLLTKTGSTLFFSLCGFENEISLWKSDGSKDNTMKIKDISMDINGLEGPYYHMNEVLLYGDILFFVTHVSGNDHTLCSSELWKSDGTSEGTTRVKTIRSSCGELAGEELIQFKGQLYFTARDEATGKELWMTDGTPEGTVLVKDIHAGESGSDPAHFAVLGDRLYFGADDGVNGRELWMTDGVETTMAKEIFAGATGSGVKNLFSFNGALFFQADDGVHGRELWESDGTADGTRLAADINPGGNHGEPGDFVAFNNMMLFSAYDKENGYEVWRYIP
jgi:ELWxxDGT repeat protein